MWSRWLVTILVILIYQFLIYKIIELPQLIDALPSGNSIGGNHHTSQNFKISPKPCTVGGIDGTCMFVWECIRSEGQHVGMCVDSFMFGSCCSHNLTENVVMPQVFSYTRPTKPVGGMRPRPPNTQHRPSISGLTTIERPHGAGTLVIRPSGAHHQHSPSHTTILHQHHQHQHQHHQHHNYNQQKPVLHIVSSTTTNKNPSLTNSVEDLETAASLAANIWNTSPQTTQWHMSTEPNFITKPRPPLWEKPSSLRPKPSKPSKKPILNERPPIIQQSTPIRKPITTIKPKPQIFYQKPTKSPILMMTTTLKPTKPVPMVSGSTTTTKSKPITTTATTKTTTTTTPKPTLPTTTTTTILLSSTVNTIIGSSENPSINSIQNSNSSSSSSTIESNEIIQVTKTPLIATVSAARTDCGQPSLFVRPETRIVGGKNAPFGRWPWQVSVRRTSFFGFSSTHRCGGALINENWIATAGHCVDDLMVSQIRIRVGEYDFSHVQEQLPYIERGVSQKVVHPKYNFFTYEYDLALVKLEQPLEFAAHVSPICLPATDDLLIGQNATVTGWGRLSEGGTLPSVLQEVSVPIVSNDGCKSMFARAGRQEFIPDIFLCAGYDTGGQDSCQGDSGGPLQVKGQDNKYFLAGIISWGIGCAEANLPGVCTRISKFVPWIMETVT